MIKVKCYSRVSEFEDNAREYLIGYYTSLSYCSEGNERRRYLNLIVELKMGKNEVNDYEGDDAYGTEKDLHSRGQK